MITKTNELLLYSEVSKTKILALDSSAKTASAAVVDGDGQLISESFVNAGLTHSETLLPMVDSVLKLAHLTMENIDACVITDGPGSFTGIRIGIAAVKGLAMPYNTQCCGVSTLKAMAYNLKDEECIACCAMDARCSQVYSAVFRCRGGKVERLTQDDAIPASKLSEILEKYANERIICVGDGAHIAYDAVKDKFSSVELAEGRRRFQSAFGAASAVLCEKTELVPAAQLLPVYLRPSQAERELSLKKG